jgi:hypothetical protein
MLALLLPSYERIVDLCKVIENTPLTSDMKFVIVANYSDSVLQDLVRIYQDRAIIVDEKPYGKMGGSKAYCLAYKVATDLGFSHAIFYADDVLPFDADWGQQLKDTFFGCEVPMGIFSSDECHWGHFGWNIMKDAPIAHFFILKCGIVPSLFPLEYKLYVIDLDISVRILRMGYSIALLPIRFNHWRSPNHRVENHNNFAYDRAVFLSKYPEYQKYFGPDGEQYIPDDGKLRILSANSGYKTEPWPKNGS